MQTPDLKIEKLPNINVEVSLLPIIAEEKPSLKIISLKLKPNFKEQESPLSRPEKEEPLSQESLEPESSPPIQVAEEPKPIYQNKEEEKSETEPVPLSMAISLPTQSDPSSFPIISAREGSGNVSKLPSPPNVDFTFTPFEPPPVNSGDDINKTSISLQKGDGKSLSNPTEFTQPKYAENPKPLYPQEAREKGYQGEVILKVEIFANGQVGQVEVKKSSGYELLDRSASATVKKWKFIPAKKGEETIPFWVNIPIKFQLQ
jgi:protein TonB